MNNEEILKDTKDTKDIMDTQDDLNKCIEYEKRICNGENILLEANTFAINKVLEISVKSPEIILVNQVTPNNNPITVDSVLVTLATAKQVIYDQLNKEKIELTKDIKNNKDSIM